MLDQNTDRMWYVIGAVIVGAGIILIANTLFPGMFDSIQTTFDEMITKFTSSAENLDVDGPAEGAGTIAMFKNMPFM